MYAYGFNKYVIREDVNKFFSLISDTIDRYKAISKVNSIYCDFDDVFFIVLSGIGFIILTIQTVAIVILLIMAIRKVWSGFKVAWRWISELYKSKIKNT